MFGGVGINQYAAAGFGAMNNAEETRKKTKAEGQSGKHASGNTALTASQDSHRETQMPQMDEKTLIAMASQAGVVQAGAAQS